ncbi:hypothetical protein [Nocardia fluminea]|uniref:hypothetical protein n=1 Tax=Nocardia fluminea TaxID=134984 RepID=UPI003648F56E
MNSFATFVVRVGYVPAQWITQFCVTVVCPVDFRRVVRKRLWWNGEEYFLCAAMGLRTVHW